MSLKVRKDWLAAPVSIYARRPRRMRPSVTKPEQFVRSLGRHGALHIIQVLHRGKRTLRYVRDFPSTPDRSGSVTSVTASP